MIYKCKGCGSALKFDTELQKLKCDYCGETYEAADYDETLGRKLVPYETMEQKIYSCSACGAQLMINDVEAATYCAYCGQPTIVFDRVSQMRKPDLILPFKITREEARNSINEKLQGMFVPKEIRNIEPEVVRGVYIPFSFSDLDYEDKQLRSGKEGNGKNTTVKYFYRHCKARFSFLPVDRSVKFNDDSAARLEPFPGNKFKPFDASYLSGFYADCGDEEEGMLEAKIKARAGDVFNMMVEKTVKAKKQQIVQNNRTVDIEKTVYGMLPVWFFACRREEGTYTIMVNGHTGKVVGAVPFDKVKVGICSALIGLPLCAILGTVCGYMFNAGLHLDDGLDDAIKIVAVAIAFVAGAAARKYAAFKKSRKLTMESAIFELAKDRQEV